MQTHQYGAHEVMELHEVMNGTIDGINTLQLYVPHIMDPELRQIVTNQLSFMTEEYNRLVHLINGRGAGMAIPYRPRATGYHQAGVAPVSAMIPNVDSHQFDDRDVSSASLGIHKASAKTRMAAALECADMDIRNNLLTGATNCAHQAYEIWNYMHRRGFYTFVSMQEAANAQLLRGYQPLQVEQAPSILGNYGAPSIQPNVYTETIFSNGFTQAPQPQPMVQSPIQQVMQPVSQTFSQPAMQPVSVSSILSTSPLQPSQSYGLYANQQTENASSIFSSPMYREQQYGSEGMVSDQTDVEEQGTMQSDVVEPPSTTRNPSRKKSGTN